MARILYLTQIEIDHGARRCLPEECQRVGMQKPLVVTDPDAALEVYRAEQPGASIAELECALLTDLVFRIPAARLADAQSPHAPVHQYLWTWGSPAFGGMIGAAHALSAAALPFERPDYLYADCCGTGGLRCVHRMVCR